MWAFFVMPDLAEKRQVRCATCGHFLIEAETELRAVVRCASCRAAIRIVIEGDRTSCEIVKKPDKPVKAT